MMNDNRNIKVEIVGNINELVECIFEKNSKDVDSNDQIFIEEINCSIQLQNFTPYESFGLNEFITLFINTGSGVASSVIAAWIIKKIDNHALTVKVNEKIIDIEKKQIEAQIDEHLNPTPPSSRKKKKTK